MITICHFQIKHQKSNSEASGDMLEIRKLKDMSVVFLEDEDVLDFSKESGITLTTVKGVELQEFLIEASLMEKL